jgi:hypothetical protein
MNPPRTKKPPAVLPPALYLATTGLTYWSREVQEKLIAGESIPIPERGEEFRVEAGEVMTEEEFTSRMSHSRDWLLEQGLVEIVYEEEPDGEVQ